MTSSSSQSLQCGLDTMIVVYCLFPGHPAALACEQLLRSRSGWFTSPFVLVERKNILTKVYGVDASAATAKLLQFAAGPVAVLDIDQVAVTSALQLADQYGLDLGDSVLLHLSQRCGATHLATDDQRLTQACVQVGISPVSPLDADLRRQVAAWETINLPSKGLPRNTAPHS